MARKIATAFIRLAPDTTGFLKDAQSGHNDVEHAAEGLGKTFGQAFTRTFGLITTALAGVLAVHTVVAFVEESNQAAREAARLMRLTEAVIKSTGGTARVTGKDIESLSYSLGEMSGVSAEVVHGAENMLLSFTEVRNQVGKGNDIFNQASAAILDMSVFMNNGTTSMEALRATSLQVGKALNNPTRGMTALARAGVVFTEQQRTQIKTLQASGNIMGAQKIILQELEREFGGAAAAAADPAQRAKVAWEHFHKEIGEFTLPIMNAFASVMVSKVIPAIRDHVIPALERMRDIFNADIVPVIRDRIIPVFVVLHQWFATKITQAVRNGLVPAITALHQLFTTKLVPAIRDHLVPALKDFAHWFMTVIVPNVRNYVIPALETIGKVLVDKVAPAVLLLIGGLYEVGALVVKFIGWLTGTSKPAEALRFVIVGIVAAFLLYETAVTAVRIATAAWGVVQAILDVELTANPIGLIIVAIGALVGAIIWVATKTTWFQATVEFLWAVLKGIGHWFANDFADFFVAGYHWVVNATTTAVLWVHDKISSIVDFVTSLPGKIAIAARGMFDGLVTAFKSAVNWLIRLWNDFHLTLGGGSILGVDIPSVTLNTPNLPYLARGGLVDKTGLAVVHRGELVGNVAELAAAIVAALRGSQAVDPRPVQNIFNLTGPSVSELAAQVQRQLAWSQGA